MKNKIGYGIVAIAVACSTMFYSVSVLPTQAANEPNSETSPVTRNVTQSFVYIITNPAEGPNAVAAYARDPETGKLKFITSYPTGGKGDPFVLAVSQHSLVTDGSYLYAVNPGSNDISVFAIQKDGTLELVGSPISSGGLSPVSLALHNKLLYVANQGDPDTPSNLTGFTVENGSLKTLDDSTVQLNFNDGTADVLFNKAGNLLVSTRVNSDIVDTFQVDSSGHLKRAARLNRQPGAFGAAFSPVADQQLLVTLSAGPGNGSYLLSDQGQISQINQVVEYPAQDPCWVVFSKDGTYAWVSSFFSSLVSLYKVDDQGKLRFISSDDTEDRGVFSTDIALDSNGKYLYQSKPFPESPKINVLRVSPQLSDNLKDGGLEEVETVEVPSGSNPIGLVVVDLTD